jgi:hypothetical protein
MSMVSLFGMIKMFFQYTQAIGAQHVNALNAKQLLSK